MQHTTTRVWNKAGILVYNAIGPDRRIIDTVPYGMGPVTILEDLAAGEERTLLRFESESGLKSYTHWANWVKISYGSKVGYVQDSYLVDLPEILDDRYLLHNYFARISDIRNHTYTGKTDDFCSAELYEYQNGIRYSFTDYGPCEQCGHSVKEIFIPELNVHQGFIFMLDYYDRNSPPEIHLEKADDSEIHLFWEYSEIRIIPQGNGILIVEDLML
ncbi:hypothetical protein [Sinomicrobium sp. M5D2P9]